MKTVIALNVVFAALAALLVGILSLEAKETVFFVGCHPDDIENCLGLMLRMKEKYDVQVIDFTRGEGGCGPEGYTNGTTAVKRIAEEREVYTTFMGDEIPGGVLEEFAISKEMKPVTWSPDMYWWYKGEYGPKEPRRK